MLTAMIPSFLIIIGSAYPLHYYNSLFRDEDAKREIYKPIILSMLINWLSDLVLLCLLQSPAFREFGIYVSVGLFLDFVLTLTVGGELLKQASRKSKINQETLAFIS